MGAGGTELVHLGCFKVRVSFPRLLDWPGLVLTCCVYQNLTSDILMGSAYFKHLTHKCFKVEIYYCVRLQIQIIVSASASWAETSSTWWIFVLSSIFRFCIAVSRLVLQHRK